MLGHAVRFHAISYRDFYPSICCTVLNLPLYDYDAGRLSQVQPADSGPRGSGTLCKATWRLALV